MGSRKKRAYWFASNTPPEEHYTVQMDWSGVRSDLESRLRETTIGWTWIQRRGSNKLKPSRLRALLGSDIEVYRKPSALTRHDITPPELVGWTAPTERTVGQMGLSRKWQEENPLWDVWVRIAPPTEATIQNTRAADQYIKDKTAQDSFEHHLEAEAERRRKLTPTQREVEDLAHAPKHMLEEAVEADRLHRASVLVAYRLNQRYGRQGSEEFDRQRALEQIQQSRDRTAEQVARMNAARAAKRGERK